MTKRLSKGVNTNVNDRVMTPPSLAKRCIEWAGITDKDKCYEPCRGKGGFYRSLPTGTAWAEIDQGRDLFEYDPGPVDVVITNPPYSCLGDFLHHMTHHVRPKRMVLLAPITNLVTKKRLRDCLDAGYSIERIALLRVLPTGWPQTGFQHGVVEYLCTPRSNWLYWEDKKW